MEYKNIFDDLLVSRKFATSIDTNRAFKGLKRRSSEKQKTYPKTLKKYFDICANASADEKVRAVSLNPEITPGVKYTTIWQQQLILGRMWTLWNKPVKKRLKKGRYLMMSLVVVVTNCAALHDAVDAARAAASAAAPPQHEHGESGLVSYAGQQSTEANRVKRQK